MRKTIQRAVGGGALLRAAALLACAVAAFAGVARARGVSSPAVSEKAASPFAIGDFDGDNQPDLATVQTGQISSWHTRYWIRFELSTGGRQDISVTAPAGGLEIASRDVNGDNALDLVVTAAWLKQPVAVLLNDGHGHFTSADTAEFAWVWGAPCSWDAPRSREEREAIAPTRTFFGEAGEAGFIVARRGCERFASARTENRISAGHGAYLGRAPPASANLV